MFPIWKHHYFSQKQRTKLNATNPIHKVHFCKRIFHLVFVKIFAVPHNYGVNPSVIFILRRIRGKEFYFHKEKPPVLPEEEITKAS